MESIVSHAFLSHLIHKAGHTDDGTMQYQHVVKLVGLPYRDVLESWSTLPQYLSLLSAYTHVPV